MQTAALVEYIDVRAFPLPIKTQADIGSAVVMDYGIARILPTLVPVALH